MPDENECTAATETPFIERCQEVRAKLEKLKADVLSLKAHSDLSRAVQLRPGFAGEMIANIMLTYRHLEDARMRMGKAIQARDGGESCYPK